jgi:hypothetical protein
VGCDLGIVVSIVVVKQTLLIRAPEFDPAKVPSIHVGGVRIMPGEIP